METKLRSNVLRFGPFSLNVRAGELHKGGRRLRLQEQPFRVLHMLVEHPGEVVTRDEIKKRLWPNETVVEFDHSINAAIKRLRDALGDTAENPKYVETVARRGYRLLVSVQWEETAAENTAQARVAPVAEADEPESTSPDPDSGYSLVGQQILHYRVTGLLGRGGMGIVYQAEDLSLGRRVALKFLPDDLAQEPKFLERLRGEARAASALNHPHICTVYQIGDYAGQPFIVMEMMEGRTLRERIAGRAGSPAPDPATSGRTIQGSALNVDELLDLTIQIADGLEAAHSNGIVHRDIKPENIFITRRGQAKILDFGLAQRVPDQDGDEAPFANAAVRKGPLSNRGTAAGSLEYMSPEQTRGEELDTRTDLFSLGAVLYEMATGRQASSGISPVEIRDAILNQCPPSALRLNPKLPPRLRRSSSRPWRRIGRFAINTHRKCALI